MDKIPYDAAGSQAQEFNTEHRKSSISGPVKDASYQPFAQYTSRKSIAEREDGPNHGTMYPLNLSQSASSIPPPPPYQLQDQVEARDSKFVLVSQKQTQQPSDDKLRVHVQESPSYQPHAQYMGQGSRLSSYGSAMTPQQSSQPGQMMKPYLQTSVQTAELESQGAVNDPPMHHTQQVVPPPAPSQETQPGLIPTGTLVSDALAALKPRASFSNFNVASHNITQPGDSMLLPPALPPRPASTHSEHYGLSPSISMPAHPTTSPLAVSHQEDRNSGSAKRFVGNMLPLRMARSAIQTAQSSVQMPMYLSPWGDNNPVTLPNVRKRDIALGAVFNIGFAEFADAAVDVVDKTVQTATKYVAEQGVDEAIAKASGHKQPKVKHMAGLMTLALRVSHKLMNEEAILVLWGEREALSKFSCAKGWFCPYLYGSGRTPQLHRSKDFGMAQLHAPGLKADAMIAPTLLSSMSEAGNPIVPISSFESPSLAYPRLTRIGIFIVGLSPYRANAWSQSRTPNECRISFHILTHTPAIVLPVTNSAPIAAWSQWTLEQMLTQTDGYNAERHYYELYQYCESIINEQALDSRMRSLWRSVLGQGLWGMIEAVVAQQAALIPMKDVHKFNLERAGIVMFRF